MAPNSLGGAMSKARYFEIGAVCLEIIVVLFAIIVAVYVSVWAGLLLLPLLLLGLISLICNYDAWVVRRISTQDDPLILSLSRLDSWAGPGEC